MPLIIDRRALQPYELVEEPNGDYGWYDWTPNVYDEENAKARSRANARTSRTANATVCSTMID